jgi:cysteine sulfinate desulfinase/cysteine desulfurase-like protein
VAVLVGSIEVGVDVNGVIDDEVVEVVIIDESLPISLEVVHRVNGTYQHVEALAHEV